MNKDHFITCKNIEPLIYSMNGIDFKHYVHIIGLLEMYTMTLCQASNMEKISIHTENAPKPGGPYSQVEA